MVCYNCHQPNHKSENCPKQHKYSRCPSCRVVANRMNDHKSWCAMPSFTSEYLNSTILKLNKFLELRFTKVGDDFKAFNARSSMIDIANLPVWIAESGVYVQRSNRPHSLIFFHSIDANRTLSIVDKKNKSIAMIVIDGSGIVVNERYDLNENGFVRYDYNGVGSLNEKAACCLVKVDNLEDTFGFEVSMERFGFVFEANQKGVLLVDPVGNEMKK